MSKLIRRARQVFYLAAAASLGAAGGAAAATDITPIAWIGTAVACTVSAVSFVWLERRLLEAERPVSVVRGAARRRSSRW